MKSSISLLLFFLALINYMQHVHAECQSNGFSKSDYFIFSQYWPQGHCMQHMYTNKRPLHWQGRYQATVFAKDDEMNRKLIKLKDTVKNKICIPEPRLTIHGYWPQVEHPRAFPKKNYNVYFFPTCCKKKKEYFDKKGYTSKILNQNWPDLTGLPERQEQLEKHGSCSGMKKKTYIKKSIKLNEHFQEAMAALKEKGIVPDNNKTYSIHDIADVLEDKFGAPPALQCNQLDKPRKGNYLHELWWCINKETGKVMYCPMKMIDDQSCEIDDVEDGDKIIIPEFDPSAFSAGNEDVKSEL